MAEVPFPRYMSDSNLDVAIDNRVNQRLFLGRIVHFSNEFYRRSRGIVSSQFDVDAALAAIVSLAASEGEFRADDARCAARIVGAWYEMDVWISRRTENATWKREAIEVLEMFLTTAAAIESTGLESEIARMAKTDHIAYLHWIDSSGVGGPSAELMCFMNPHWRSSGFIYGSPFDGQLEPDGSRLRQRYSEVARLCERGLFPPRSANTRDAQAQNA